MKLTTLIRSRFAVIMLIALMLVLALPKPVYAADAPDFYAARELNIDIFGSATTPDLDGYTTGAGVGVTYFLSRNFGAGATITGDWSSEGQTVDNAGAHAIYRIPIQRSAIYLRAGPTWSLRADTWAIDVGPGIEHRLTRNIGFFGEALLNKPLSGGDVAAVGRLGLRLAW